MYFITISFLLETIYIMISFIHVSSFIDTFSHRLFLSFMIKVYTQVIQDMWDYLRDEKEIESPEELIGLPIR